MITTKESPVTSAGTSTLCVVRYTDNRTGVTPQLSAVDVANDDDVHEALRHVFLPFIVTATDSAKDVTFSLIHYISESTMNMT